MDDPDPFRQTLLYSAHEEPERYLRKVDYDPTDHGAERIAQAWAEIDTHRAQRFSSVREIASATGQPYGAVAVALRQRDGFGLLDPATEAALARTVHWAYGQAPSRPFGLVLAGPTAPARGVRVKPERPFGVEEGSRPEQRHGKLWRVFMPSLYGPLIEGNFPFAWEAPLSARVRAAELDTEDSALRQERVKAIVDPLGYVTDFLAATVASFERHKPPGTPELALLISMGRRDQQVAVNGLRQDRRGESLAGHAGWATAIRRACGQLIPVVEVAHPKHEQQLLGELEYRTAGGVLLRSDRIVPWVTADAPAAEWDYLPDDLGGVSCALLNGQLIDRNERRAVGRLIVALPRGAPARLLAIPNEIDDHGLATVTPTLDLGTQKAIERVITGWAAENNYTGSCRRRSWFGWEHFATSANDIDAIELAWRYGAVVRFWNIKFTPQGPVGI